MQREEIVDIRTSALSHPARIGYLLQSERFG